MQKKSIFLVLAGIALFAVGACVAAQPDNSASQQEIAVSGLLADVMARGTLRIGTTDDYAPQSDVIEGAVRADNTKCAEDEFTANQLEGFEVTTAVEIATRLGVEPCFQVPSWEAVVGGEWKDQWDIFIGSMTITEERAEKFRFLQPHYTIPAMAYVPATDTTSQSPGDLSGKKIAICHDCSYEAYLNGTLEIPGMKVGFQIDNATIDDSFVMETDAFAALVKGEGQYAGSVGSLLSGMEAMRNGLQLRQLGTPLFFEYLAPVLDKKSSQDITALGDKINQIMQQLHGEGKLLEWSQQYYSADLTSAAAKFNIRNVER